MAKKKQEIQTFNQLLAGVERLFLQIMIGLIAPVAFLLIGWWGSLPFVLETSIKYFALGGLLAGIFIDALFLRRWVRKAYNLPVAGFVLVYLFYSICMYGFFMGMPALNFLLGIMGGYYVGLCLRYTKKGKDEVSRDAQRTAFFAAGVLAILCIASWLLAYSQPTIASEIQGMLNLAREISREQVLIYSAIAGAGLVAAEYFLTRAMVKFACFI
jgi:hypothetical protein